MVEIAILLLAFVSLLLPVPLNVFSFILTVIFLFLRERKMKEVIRVVFGLSHEDMKPLLNLSNPFTVKDYADEAGISWETALKRLERLSKKGVVIRKDNAYFLSDKGKEFLRRWKDELS
jgi:predicted transcriptional regulator